jgi:hypothetical protein
MAEKAPTTAKTATADAAPEGKQKQEVVKPERPDEAVFKEGLAKYDREHEQAKEKFVGTHRLSLRCQSYCTFI